MTKISFEQSIFDRGLSHFIFNIQLNLATSLEIDFFCPQTIFDSLTALFLLFQINIIKKKSGNFYSEHWKD